MICGLCFRCLYNVSIGKDEKHEQIHLTWQFSPRLELNFFYILETIVSRGGWVSSNPLETVVWHFQYKWGGWVAIVWKLETAKSQEGSF